MSGLSGKRVALLEARMSGALGELVRRNGGEPLCVPAVRESPVACAEEVADFVSGMVAGSFRVVIFQTGVGAMALFREAEKLGRLAELIAALNLVTTVCRGPKPSAALKRTGVQITVSVPEPHTTAAMLEALTQLEIKDTGVALMHYGERNAPLAEALQIRGARLHEMCLYEWLMPEDIQPLKDLVEEIVRVKIDVVAFTSQVQVRHLFRVAEELGLASELAHALNSETIVASIGPTCTATLQGYGVEPHVIPEHGKMGHLISALVQRVGGTEAPET